MGAYAGAARRRVHLATYSFCLRLAIARRQARHARILRIGLRLAIAQADARPTMSDCMKSVVINNVLM